ncbi:MAG: hypothetical protein O2936_08160 [Proteobacteria bacterium]|nr:hypothetical protein [Pseudomonadota bacterium]
MSQPLADRDRHRCVVDVTGIRIASIVGRSDLTAVNEALDHPIELGPSALVL